MKHNDAFAVIEVVCWSTL